MDVTAKNLLRTIAATNALSPTSDAGRTLSEHEAAVIVDNLAANFSRRDVIDAIGELGALTKPQRGGLTLKDLARLDQKAHIADYVQPALEDAIAEVIDSADRDALGPAHRDGYDRASAVLLRRIWACRNAFATAGERGRSGADEQALMSRLHRELRSLNRIATQLAQHQAIIDASRSDASIMPNTTRYLALVKQFALKTQ